MYLPTRRKCHWITPNRSLFDDVAHDSPWSAGIVWGEIGIDNISSISIIRRKSSIKKEVKKHQSISRQFLIIRSLSFQYSLSLLGLLYADGVEFLIHHHNLLWSRNEDNPLSTGVWRRNAHEIINHRISDKIKNSVSRKHWRISASFTLVLSTWDALSGREVFCLLQEEICYKIWCNLSELDVAINISPCLK